MIQKDYDPNLNHTSGERLRAAREARGLSLQQLAMHTDGALLKSRTGNCEQGIRRLSVEAACTLTKALGNVSAAHLLCVDDVEAGFSTEERLLLTEFRGADARQRETILNIAELQHTFS